MAHNRFRSTGEYGSEPATAWRDSLVTNREDASVQAMKAPGSHSPPNAFAIDPDLCELRGVVITPC